MFPRLTSSLSSSRTMSTFATIPPSNIIPTKPLFHHQASLPKLPLPSLSDTLNKYLITTRPLLSDAEFAATEAAVHEFAQPGGMGETLQKRLLDHAQSNSSTSWLYDWWNEIAYMGYRDPVVINVNYFFQFMDNPVNLCQTERAAQLIQAALAFRKLVISQDLPPETARKQPLCSIQYNYLFNSCRVPQLPSDIPATYDPNSFHHIIVLHNNNIYAINIIDPINGQPHSTKVIRKQLDNIISYSNINRHKPLPIGALTTENRDIWAQTRDKLLALDPRNGKSIEIIQSAMFAVCLDGSSPVTREEVARALWHGDGRNRWFDKHIQFIVFANGKAGFNGEHSMMDATPTGRMCEWMLDALEKNKIQHGSPTEELKNPFPWHTRLEFVIDADIAGAINEAERKFDKMVAEHDLQVLAYPGYGKGLIKTFGVSPDAYVQLSLQLAYYRMYGQCRATYESAQTRNYAYGRTETGRSVSNESVSFVKAMCEPNVSAIERVTKAKAAIAYHVKYMKEASEGYGVDRHLLGLRMVLHRNEKKPAIFTDPAFAKSCHWNLSTSQLTSEYFDGYGWGEVVPDGYGLAYMIKERSIHINIVSRHLYNLHFRHYLTGALDDMRFIFEQANISDVTSGTKSKL